MVGKTQNTTVERVTSKRFFYRTIEHVDGCKTHTRFEWSEAHAKRQSALLRLMWCCFAYDARPFNNPIGSSVFGNCILLCCCLYDVSHNCRVQSCLHNSECIYLFVYVCVWRYSPVKVAKCTQIHMLMFDVIIVVLLLCAHKLLN